MNGYNVLIPSVCRDSSPEITLPVMDALQALGHTPVVMDMASISSMYRQMRYERHGCYEIFQFYLRDLLKRGKVDFGFSVGLGVVLVDGQKNEHHHLLEECEVPNIILLHSREPGVIERLDALDARGWRHTFITVSTSSLAGILESHGYKNITHCPPGTNFRIFYPADNPPGDAPFPLKLDDPRLTADYDVSFTGSFTPGRARLLQALSDAGVALAIFGDERWKQSTELARAWRNKVHYLAEVNTIYNASKINLDLPHDECVFDDYVSSRVADCLAGENFLLAHRRKCLGDYAEPDREIATFEGEDELKKTVEYYLGDGLARQKIATRGYHRVLAEAGWGNRLERLLPQLEMHLLTAAVS